MDDARRESYYRPFEKAVRSRNVNHEMRTEYYIAASFNGTSATVVFGEPKEMTRRLDVR
jgi:hypothetical protein